MTTCDCMTEPNPMDPSGPEVVLTHSSGCPLHPEYEVPYGDCSVCTASVRLTRRGLIFKHERWARRRYEVCAGSGLPSQAINRVRSTRQGATA